MKRQPDPRKDWSLLRDDIIGLGHYSARRSFFPELQQRVDQLQESRQRLLDIVEFLPDATWVIDREGRVIAWNKACETLTGIPAADMVGKGDYEYSLPFYGKRRPLLIDVALQPGLSLAPLYAGMDRKNETLSAEVFLPRVGPDGIHLSMTARALYDTNGQLAGAIESVRDITGRKRIEASLAASERKYRQLFENMTTGFALHETILDEAGRPSDYRFLEANPAFERLTGVPVAMVIGKTVSEAIPGIGPGWPEACGRVAATGESESCHVHAQALGRHFDCLAFRPERGQVAVIFTDVTAHRLAEEAREYSERRMTELLESMQLAAVTLDPQGRVTFCNNFLQRLTGWSREEAVGSDWCGRFVPGPDRETVRAMFRSGVSSGSMPETHENPVLARDGRIRTIVWQNTVLHGPDGAVTGVASIGNDVTDQRSLEEQLRQSQKMEAVGQLAGGVAHDFNNLLTVIIGYGNMAKMKMKPDSPERLNLDQVIDAAGRATELTRGLLAFSRKQVMSPRPCDLGELIRDVEKFLRRIIGEDIRLDTEAATASPAILVDKVQIEQVMINLATNARDAMPRGGTLSISTGLRDLDDRFLRTHGYGTPGRFAEIAISDTGIGMPEETRARIFEPFYTTKEPGKGTGLGLSIVYGIVKQHNGFITVDSAPGAGTTFRIYLPLAGTPSEGGLSVARRPVPARGTETILVAEDDPVVRGLVEAMLREFGYEVVLAADGQEAIERFAEHRGRIRLLLMDLIMPRKNGREAWEEIRRMAPDIKVLFASGYTADIIRYRGELEEGAELVFKPLDPMALAAKVREVLDRS